MKKAENNIPEFQPFGGHDFQTDATRASIHILPVCYEHKVSYGTGTRTAPLYLLEASEQLEQMDDETMTNWGELEFHTRLPFFPSDDPEKSVDEIKNAALESIKAGKFLLAFGGDHSVSIGLIKAASEIYPEIGVIQIDAHSDLRDTWNGSRNNHACIMRRVVSDMKLKTVQVGIRSFSPEEVVFMKEKGLKPFFAHETEGRFDWIEEAIEELPENVYLTIDVDGLDPSVMPGTGTPEPGGLAYRQLTRLISELGKKRNVMAADITELSKIPGSQVSEFTAARIASKIMIHCHHSVTRQITDR